MNSIEIHIKEINKGSKRLTLQNLREELVGFLYRDTVARATRADMQFYILMFFAVIPKNNSTVLEYILDEGLPKFKRLNDTLQNKNGYLQTNEYHALVEQHELTKLFYKDLFFVITNAVINITDIRSKFEDIIVNQNMSETFDRLEQEYKPTLEQYYQIFKSSKIQDDRYDDNGIYHDLSKSVYRTVLMRSSKNLELNLQKYTAVKKIESNSPIDLTFLQFIDPNTVLELWDKYHVARYTSNIVSVGAKITDNGLISGGLLLVVERYLNHRNTHGNIDRKKKREAKKELDIVLMRNNELTILNERLTESVLKANERLESDLKELKKERRDQAIKSARDTERIKELTKRIEDLENLQIEAKIEDSKGDQLRIDI